MRATGANARAPSTASSASMSEYQNTPSPRRLMPRNIRQTGAIRTAQLKRMHKAWSQRRSRSRPDSSLDMGGLPPGAVDFGSNRSGDIAQNALQVVEGPVPGSGLRSMPRFHPKGRPQIPVPGELRSHADKLNRVALRREEPAHSMAHILLRGGVIVGDHRKAARHRFERHVSEGLGGAGKDEHVGGGVVFRQVLAGTHPREDEFRMPLAQRRALRTIPDQNHAHLRVDRLHPQDRIHEQPEILLRRDAANVQSDGLAPGTAPSGAQPLAAPGGIEELRIHAAPDYGDALESKGFEVRPHLRRRH